MKTLILRTFSHNKNWDKEKNICIYDHDSFDVILEWESNIVQNANSVTRAIGIYNQLYYTYVDKRGIRSFSNTPQEENPSLLQLNNLSPTNLNHACINPQKNNLNISYSLVSKISNINRKQMLEIDKILVEEKIRVDKIKIKNPNFTSLCFTLEEDFVKKVFAKYHFNF